MIDYRQMDREGNFPESDFEFSKRPENAEVFTEVSDDTIYLIQNLQKKYQSASKESRKLVEEETNPLFYVGLIIAAFAVGKFI